MQLFSIKWPINVVKIFDRVKIYKQPWYHITNIKRIYVIYKNKNINDLSPFAKMSYYLPLLSVVLSPFVKSVIIINTAYFHTKGDNTLCL